MRKNKIKVALNVYNTKEEVENACLICDFIHEAFKDNLSQKELDDLVTAYEILFSLASELHYENEVEI